MRNLAFNCLVFLVEKKFVNAPYKNKRDQIRPCCKIRQGQPRDQL